MNGHEVAIDRATPKDDNAGKHFMRPTPVSQRRSFDNGSGLVGPGLTPLLNYQPMGGLASDNMAAAAFQAMRALSGDPDMTMLESAAAAAACAAAVSAAAGSADMGGGGRASFDAAGRPSFDGGRSSFDAGRPSFDNGSCSGLDMPVATGALTEEDLAKGAAGRTSSGSLGLLNGLGGSMATNVAIMQNIAKAQAALGAMGQMQGLGGMPGLPQLGGLSLDNSNPLFGGEWGFGRGPGVRVCWGLSAIQCVPCVCGGGGSESVLPVLYPELLCAMLLFQPSCHCACFDLLLTLLSAPRPPGYPCRLQQAVSAHGGWWPQVPGQRHAPHPAAGALPPLHGEPRHRECQVGV
jgi:hypothetical protein